AGAPAAPFGTLLGAGLDARLFTDLSFLGPDRLLVPNDKFFVRTSYPPMLDASQPWTVALGGLVARPHTVAIDELRSLARPFGPCVLECAGNTNPSNFGLLSAADWDGVPIGALLDRTPPNRRAARVLVSGVDDLTRPSRTSVPGASWIFTRDDLE